MMRQRLATERELGANVLTKRRTFAAFPRLKFAFGQQLHCLNVTTSLI